MKWTVTLKEGEDESKVNGIFKLPEISNAVHDDDEEFQIDIEYKTGEEHRDKIHGHIKGEVLAAIRKNLIKYVDEFKDIDLSK